MKPGAATDSSGGSVPGVDSSAASVSSLSGIDYSKYSNYFGNSKSSGGKSLATPLSGSVRQV